MILTKLLRLLFQLKEVGERIIVSTDKLTLAVQRVSADIQEAVTELKAARDNNDQAGIDAAVAKLDAASAVLESGLTTVPDNPENPTAPTA